MTDIWDEGTWPEGDVDMEVDSIDLLVEGLRKTVDTNGREIVKMLLDFANETDYEWSIGREAKNFAKAAIAMLQEAGEDNVSEIDALKLTVGRYDKD